MIKKNVTVLTILMIFSIKVYAQRTILMGKVINKETNKPISNATITFIGSNNSTYHTISDSIGKFSFRITLINKYILKITAFNYVPFINDKTIISPDTLNLNLGTIKLIPYLMELKEVVIKSTKRYRDTTKIEFSGKNFERSIMIDDLFNNNGLYKDSQGQLFYKGKLVSALLVNGHKFFEKDNLDIYKYLPALTVNDIQIIETNIDDLTNATLTNPTIKINLRLKEKYNKGLFGNTNIGAGTINRYVGNINPHYYKNNEQISLSINSNNININDDPLVEPRVSFSANGNNVVSNSSKFTYRNVFDKNIEVNFSIKGKLESKSYTSELERQEETKTQISKTSNSSNSKLLNIEGGNLRLNYTINTLNTITFNQNYNYHQSKQIDSLNYTIVNEAFNSVSSVLKKRNTSDELFSSNLLYQKRFASKKGRLLNVNLGYNNEFNYRNENDNVFSLFNQTSTKYFINGKRYANNNKYTLSCSFDEPVWNDGSLQLFASYKKDELNYKTIANSDTTGVFVDNPVQLVNSFVQSGIKFHKVWHKFSFDESGSGIFDFRLIDQFKQEDRKLFLNPNFDSKISYKISGKKEISLGYLTDATYPNIAQITSINNSFDLISQMQGNVKLNPEIKSSIILSYNFRKSDSLMMNVSGGYDHYNSKFGYNIINTSNTVQTTIADNLGSASSLQATFLLASSFKRGRTLNYSANISYQEMPTIANGSLFLNKSILFNQSVSTTTILLRKKLYLSPSLTTTFNKYQYQSSISSIMTATYSDKISLIIGRFQINTYPLANYSYSIDNKFTWAVNGDMNFSIFKNLGLLWVRAYDIFNSFKYFNTYASVTYIQTIKFSNLNRYILAGLSLKFNNTK